MLQLRKLTGSLIAGQRDKQAIPESSAPFLPSLAGHYLLGGSLPVGRRLATLFIDIADSSRLLMHHPPETVLHVVQCFMRLVTEVSLAYHGDVKDYEGDGALLYFESTAEATRAALAIRSELARGRCDAACDTGRGVAARMSLTVGHMVVGVVGSARRRAVTLLGPSVNLGARLLKRISPGGIIASGDVLEALTIEAPELARKFRLLEPAFVVPGTDGIRVATYTISESQEPENAYTSLAPRSV